jgi:4-hydroxy-tetrahydrodipicolinate synthase
MHKLAQAALAGDAALAREWHLRTLPLHKCLFVEANPIPVKWALNQMGRIKSGIRLPLVPLSATFQEPVRQALTRSGIAL